MTDSGEGGDEGDESVYGGIVGAFPYAYRTSESRLFRIYLVSGGLLAAVVVVLFALAVVVLVGNTASAPGGTFTFSRAFFLFLMLLVVGPLVAPVLAVARRHRRQGSSVTYDRALAAGGCLFMVGLYLGLVVSTPAGQQRPTTGPLGPVLDALYALPRPAGALPPILGAALIYVFHRRYR